MGNEEDLWGTSSDIVTDYEGMVVDAWFNKDPNIMASPTFLWLKLSTDNPEHEVVTEKYNCGPDWVSNDGGETVTHPTKKKFSGNSQAGILVSKAVEYAGAELRERGIAPTTAASWLGTQWYMEATERSGKLANGQDFRSVKNYPTKFLGIEEDYASKKADGEADGARVDMGKTDQPTLMNVPASPVMQIMQNLAKELTHDEWVDRVLMVDGVLQDDDLIRQLPDSTDDGLYMRLRNHE